MDGRCPGAVEITKERDARSPAVAGALLMLAGVSILMGIITAEALFTVGYETDANTISDLGSTWQPGDVVREPSATIFNLTMVATGILIAGGAWFLRRVVPGRAVPVAVAVLGVSVFAVGIFPGEEINGEPSSSGVHPIAAMLAFTSGGIAAVLSGRVTSTPFRWIAVALGSIALLSLVLSGPLGDTSLGIGGIERWVAYPVVLWLVAFGGYLAAAGAGREPPAAAADG
ncbi:MAG: DUF998 domain-containing protein [Solirubrobacterales bacterium]|nr:DUF998 domain-containing protein [Solirubrobacterales bacterium]